MINPDYDKGFEKTGRIGRLTIDLHRYNLLWGKFLQDNVEIIEEKIIESGVQATQVQITGRSLYFDELEEGEEIPFYNFVIEFEAEEPYVPNRIYCKRCKKQGD